ncbi:MAG TPA: hypothetical protein VM223_22620 [Planctomycetota bacterium]|nr:hypothetical protein [Planctomycetota bacterium]
MNTRFRDFGKVNYHTIETPAERTVHVRHYLFVKPDYFVVWDTFEEAHGASTFWLHPMKELKDEGNGFFRAGEAGAPHLRVQFVLPAKPDVIENVSLGNLWSFGVRNGSGQPYLAVLVPQKDERGIVAAYDEAARTLHLTGKNVDDTIVLPEPGSVDQLPKVVRGAGPGQR